MSHVGAVCVTFDFDAVSGALGRGQLTGTPISRGEFAAVAVPRLLETLRRRGVVSTWFVPGHTALTYPELTNEILAAGHEIAVHGHAHRNVAALEEADERADLERSLEALRSTTGLAPLGFQAPAWDLSDSSVRLLVEHGMTYDSSLMGHDYAPYLEFLRSAAGTLPGLRDTDAMFANWTGDLDYMLRDVRNGVLTVTMHPEVIGRGHRLLALERWLDGILERPIELTTTGDVARRFAEGERFGEYAPS